MQRIYDMSVAQREREREKRRISLYFSSYRGDKRGATGFIFILSERSGEIRAESRRPSRLRPLNIVERGVRARVGSRLASFVPRPQRKLSFKPKTGLNIL